MTQTPEKIVLLVFTIKSLFPDVIRILDYKMTQAENLERLMDKKSLKIRKQNCSAENMLIIIFYLRELIQMKGTFFLYRKVILKPIVQCSPSKLEATLGPVNWGVVYPKIDP